MADNTIRITDDAEYFVNLTMEGDLHISNEPSQEAPHPLHLTFESKGFADAIMRNARHEHNGALIIDDPRADAYTLCFDVADPTMPPVIFHKQYEGILPGGDIAENPHDNTARPFELEPKTIERLNEFHNTHPNVNLNPIINDRIHDLIDECYHAESN